MKAKDLRKISDINLDKRFGNVINKIESYMLASAKEGMYSCNYRLSSDDPNFVEKIVRHFTNDEYSCSCSKTPNDYYLHISW